MFSISTGEDAPTHCNLIMDPRRRRGSKKQNLDKGKGRSSCHPPTDRESLEVLKSKSLYMCTSQLYSNFHSKWVVHRIRMSDILSSPSPSPSPSSPSGSAKIRLNQVATESGSLPCDGGCGVFKSTIFFGGGLEMEKTGFASYDGPPLSKRMFYVEEGHQRVKPFFPSLIGGKEAPLLMEIKGELYVIDGDQFEREYDEERFERFDEQSNQWKPLPRPPIWDRSSVYYHTQIGLTSVITDISILISRPRKTTPIFRFDFTNPNAGWSETKLKYFPFKGTTLVHKCPSYSGGFIISVIDLCPEGDRNRFPRIKLYRMSEGYDTLNLLGTMELPSTDYLSLVFTIPATHTFLDLGDQRVGLVLTKSDNKMLKFLVATFQYKINPFSYQCLSEPVELEYDVLVHPEPFTQMVDLLGAFVL
ncbi:hypothetical protein OROGR_022127 [Orobanche gracilis]